MTTEATPTPPDAPTWLAGNEIAMEEWRRVAASVPAERLGILATYCKLHAKILQLLDETDPKGLGGLIGQYRTLGAALFGAGSKRVQPGKNPFAALRNQRTRRIAPRWRNPWIRL